MAIGSNESNGRWGEHNAERRRVILEAAVALIEDPESGPDIPLQAIADRAGVKRSVIYRHFADRTDLDAQTRAFAVLGVAEELVTGLNLDGSIDEVIYRTVEKFARWISAHAKLHEWIEQGPGSHAPSGQELVTGTKAAIAERIVAIFRMAMALLGAEDEPGMESMVFGVVAMVDGALTRWVRTRPDGVDAAAMARMLTTTIVYVIDGHARARGLVLDPHRPLNEVLGVSLSPF
ncbi:TetR/AcrR family transcriptional regulator [Nocardia colli]|uniref:TetR/AcrR family transcriptional regulator n=1 Tax=Nocardia colli TaxID=2545717 RepID=UPI00168CADD5|nr:TetR/AcrR family transcriptional regulator [Nocardia colli]